jgi:hypothetical protein
VRRGSRPKDLGTLDGSRGGLILPGRVKVCPPRSTRRGFPLLTMPRRIVGSMVLRTRRRRVRLRGVAAALAVAVGTIIADLAAFTGQVDALRVLLFVFGALLVGGPLCAPIGQRPWRASKPGRSAKTYEARRAVVRPVGW